MNCRPLNFDTLNPKVKKVQYAVRGAIVIRATEIEKELSQVKLYSSLTPSEYFYDLLS